MSKFYTFAGSMDNAIYHRYYDENKQSVIEKVEQYDYTLYAESTNVTSDFKSLKGRPLKEFRFKTPYELSKFYRENKDLVDIHGNDSAVHQFLSKEYNYDVQQTCDVSVLNFDIEVEHAKGFVVFPDDHIIQYKKEEDSDIETTSIQEFRKIKNKELYTVYDERYKTWTQFHVSCYVPIGFPKADEARGEIMSISAKKFGKNENFYSFGTKPLSEYDNPKGVCVQCKDEKELLVRFVKFWRDTNPDIITGWNVDGFDIPYLINRMKKVLGKKSVAFLSPFKDKVKNNEKLITEKLVGDNIVYEIFGITIYDYIELYKKYSPTKRESYKLDYIGEVEIDQKKVNFDEYKKSLMNLYEGVITVDLKTPFTELDNIMKYARIQEVVRRKLDSYGYSIDKGDKFLGEDVSRFDLETFDFGTIKNADNDTLKGMYNFCKERIETLSYKKFITYNEQDANIVELLDNKMMFIKQAIRVAHMSRSRLKEIFGTVSPWDNMIYSRLLSKNIQIPPREVFEKDEKFTGAYVKKPVLGFHKWIVSFDYKSLYPSIIRLLRMSPESLRKGQDDKPLETLQNILDGIYNTDEAKSNGCGVAGNGSVFDQSFNGVLPETMKYLMEERDLVKMAMKDKDRELQKIKECVKNGTLYESLTLAEMNSLIEKLENEISMMDATQQALKILANSGYGAIGNTSFRYFRIDIAEAITLTGQLALRFVSSQVDKYLNEMCGTKDVVYAIYGDTDSIYVTLDNWVKYHNIDESDADKVIDKMNDFVNADLSPFICSKNEELSKYLGAKENLLIMKREALADAMIFRGKKNYIIQVYDNEFVRYSKPKIKMMGVETAKSSTAMIIRKKLEECFQIVINKDTRDVSELKALVDEFRSEFNEADIVSIASPKGVNDIDKWIDERGNIKSGCPIHVRGSIVYNEFIKTDSDMENQYERITNASKIRYVNLKLPNILHSHVVAFIDDIPPEMELEKYVDRKTQFEKTFMGPLESFTNLIDWDVRRTTNLMSLFDDEDEDLVQIEEKEVVKKQPTQQNKKVSMDSLFS